MKTTRDRTEIESLMREEQSCSHRLGWPRRSLTNHRHQLADGFYSAVVKSLALGLLALSCSLVLGQNKELTADENIPIPTVTFDAEGELQITASSNSSPNDFDFLVGKWKMHNRDRKSTRLNSSHGYISHAVFFLQN